MKDNKNKKKDNIIQNTPKLKRRQLFIFERKISESNIYNQIDELNKKKINAMNSQKRKSENVIVIEDDNDVDDIKFITPKKNNTKKKSEVIDLDKYVPSSTSSNITNNTPVIYIDSDDDSNNFEIFNKNDDSNSFENKIPIKRNLYKEFFSKEFSNDFSKANNRKKAKTEYDFFNLQFKKNRNNDDIKNKRNPDKNKTTQNSIEHYFIRNNKSETSNSNTPKKTILNNNNQERKTKNNNASPEKKPIQKNLIVNYFSKDNSTKTDVLNDNSFYNIEEKLMNALKKVGIEISSESDIDDNETIVKNNVEVPINNNIDNSETINDDLKESSKSDIDSSSSDELDLISMDRNVESLFGIVNEKQNLTQDEEKNDKEKEKEKEKEKRSNKINDNKFKLLNNSHKFIEKRKNDMSIFDDNNSNSNSKIKPLFNLRYEIQHKDDIDRLINFNFETLDEDYESKIENEDIKNENQDDDEQSSTNLLSDLVDEDGKAPLTKKETKELKEFMNIDQKKFSTIIVNLFPDFNNKLNDWYQELSNNNSSNTNTKYLRNNKEKENKNLYEMCITDNSLCKLIVSQKLFYIYYKDKIKEFKDQYLELLLKIICFERNIIYSRNAMISIKDLFLKKEIYDEIQKDHENNIEESKMDDLNDINNQQLKKLLYSPVDFLKKILSFFGFRIKDYNLQINQIKNNIDNLKSCEKKIYEEIHNYGDSMSMFAICNTIQYNILDNEELRNQVEKNIHNDNSYLPIQNFKIIIELIESISIFCINNNINFHPSEVIFLITMLYMDYNIKNIKTQLQYTIKHIIQNLNNETWTKEGQYLAELFLYFYNQSPLYQYHILTLFTFSGCHPRITKFKSSIAKLFIKPSLFDELFNNNDNKLYPISKFVEDTLLIDENIYNLNDNTDFQEIFYRISIYYHCFGYIDEVSKIENKDLIQKATKKLWILHNRIPDMLASHIDRTFSKNFILQLIQYLNSLFIKTKVTI